MEEIFYKRREINILEYFVFDWKSEKINEGNCKITFTLCTFIMFNVINSLFDL